MNLLCPNCQKMLTVPEEFAGRLMKCPLCAGTFTVPGLPSNAPAPEPGLPPQAAAPATPALSAPAEAPPVTPGPAALPAPQAVHPEPAPAAPSIPTPVAPPPAPSAAPSMGYTQAHTLTFNPKVLRWIPAVAVVLIFFLQFFPWVGVYPGGVAAAWQTAWEAAFASYGEEKDMRAAFHFTTPEELKEANKDVKEDKDKLKDNRPGVNILLVFYLLPFFLLTLIVTVGVLVVTLVPMKLPGALEGLLQFRWTLVAGLNLITFLFLVLQLVLGFSLEKTFQERVAEDIARVEKAQRDDKHAPPKLLLEAQEKERLLWLHRTTWLRLAVFLHVVAILASGLMAWVEKRGNRPPPRLVLET